jgi:hypothetical protein
MPHAVNFDARLARELEQQAGGELGQRGRRELRGGVHHAQLWNDLLAGEQNLDMDRGNELQPHQRHE